jgi:pimeloyl-ACP methyl ester carboxylesterase
MGDREVICDATQALARARRLIPDFEGTIVPGASHDMCFSQRRLVDARVRAFLDKSRTNGRGERWVA